MRNWRSSARLFALLLVTAVPSAADAAAQSIIGGRNLTIRSDGGVTLTWEDGDVETGYLVLRGDATTGSWIVLPNGVLPADASTVADTPPNGRLSCYLVVAMSDTTPVGTPESLCVLPGDRRGAFPPGGFTLSTERPGPEWYTITRLSWTPSSDPNLSIYRVINYALDGDWRASTSGDSLAPDVLSASGVIPDYLRLSCYLVYAIGKTSPTGPEYSWTDLLCAPPRPRAPAANP